MSNLLVVESPAKCQKIRSFLGSDWNVVATMGHLRALVPQLDAVGCDTGFQPKYEWLKEKSKAIHQLKQAMEEATKVYLASDDDREGEMISYSVCLLGKLPFQTTPRIVFHEITQKAILHAIENPRLLDMNRVEAQQARAMLDMMIGFTMSPLLWKYVAPTLSAGRCQTPALRLVIEREDAIDSFVSIASWQMDASWKHEETGVLLETRMVDELEDEESVQHVLEHAHENAEGTLLSSVTSPWTESAPPPLMTSTLQQQASQLYHFSPKQTMSIAQRLYEAGHITYMRTDKAVMSEEAKEDARRWIRENYGEEYIASLVAESSSSSLTTTKKVSRRPKAKKEEGIDSKAQEAHEAIRPTHMEVISLSSEKWGPAERKLYELISRRSLQSVMAAARGKVLQLHLQLDGLEDFPWKAESKWTEFEGWKRLGAVAKIEDGNEPQDEEEKSLVWIQWQSLKVGDRLKWKVMTGKEKESRSQGRYTEAMLVRELENHGIGRPSTFASLLSVIQEKKYVEVVDLPSTEKQVKGYQLEAATWPYRIESKKKKMGGEKRKLIPTALGRSVWEWMKVHFEDLFTYQFTADMEKQLDQIAEGVCSRQNLLQMMWDSYRVRYNSLLNTSTVAVNSQSSASLNPAKQRIFTGGLKAIQTKKGPLLLREGATKEATIFLGWPKGISWDKLTEEKAIAYEEDQRRQMNPDQIAIWREKPVYKKTGPYGVYLQWDTTNIPWLEGETIEEMESRLEKRINQPSVVKEGKNYVIRNSQYGLYIMKKTKTTKTKKPICISLPRGLDPSQLTEKEMERIYQMGVEQKNKKKPE